MAKRRALLRFQEAFADGGPAVGTRVWVRAIGSYGRVTAILPNGWRRVITTDREHLTVIPSYLVLIAEPFSNAPPGGEA